MENSKPSNDHFQKNLRRSSTSHVSMSDTESTNGQVDMWHSPSLQLENENNYNNKNILKKLPSDKFYSPLQSPCDSNIPASSPAAGGKVRRPWPRSEKFTAESRDFPANGTSLNRFVKEEPPPPRLRQVGPVGGVGVLEEEYAGERRSGERKWAFVLRVFEVILCVISFSIMATDKTQGWSGDSFNRYKEYRYCLAVNVIGFVYSGFEAYDLSYYLGTGKHLISHHLRYHLEFLLDQILAYLLISASSSAATRTDDWISNWGKDEFTLRANVSTSMSFLAFGAFALSSLVSGYSLCNRNSN